MCQSGSNTKTLKNCIFKKMFKMKAIFQNFVYIVRNSNLVTAKFPVAIGTNIKRFSWSLEAAIK